MLAVAVCHEDDTEIPFGPVLPAHYGPALARWSELATLGYEVVEAFANSFQGPLPNPPELPAAAGWFLVEIGVYVDQEGDFYDDAGTYWPASEAHEPMAYWARKPAHVHSPTAASYAIT